MHVYVCRYIGMYAYVCLRETENLQTLGRKIPEAWDKVIAQVARDRSATRPSHTPWPTC